MRTFIIVLASAAALVAATAPPSSAQPRGPNGQIVFARFDPLLDDTTIYTANPDGSHARQALGLPAACPRWSPDGTRILTCASRPAGRRRSSIRKTAAIARCPWRTRSCSRPAR